MYKLTNDICLIISQLSGHLETIAGALVPAAYKYSPVAYNIPTHDGDEIEILYFNHKKKKLAILTHGLEGNNQSTYIVKTANYLLHHDICDVIAWNFRSCGHQDTLKPMLYHSGYTQDLHTLISHILQQHSYEHILLAGYSVGGNVVLKYMGEMGHNLPYSIKSGVAFCCPCDLESVAGHMDKGFNRIYTRIFLKKLIHKVRQRAVLYPHIFDTEKINQVTSFFTFDEYFTATNHGFAGAHDYWIRASSLPYFNNIVVPFVIVNPLNDVFLTPKCYPKEINNTNFTYLYPPRGGHCAFITLPNIDYYPATIIADFINK
ncbi:MAG: alpha/beta hydrolase [Cytophagales bacterium]|nr:alpha/beta hydrolase [Cytophagales bacterium]